MNECRHTIAFLKASFVSELADSKEQSSSLRLDGPGDGNVLVLTKTL